MKVALEKGIKEARILLEDWLIILYTRVNKVIMDSTKKVGENITEKTLDMNFNHFTNLAKIPRFIYSLLKSPLYSKNKFISSDHWIFMYSLTSALDADSFANFIYPNLSAFSSPDQFSRDSIPLSNSLLTSSDFDRHFFFLDAFHSLVVYHPFSAALLDSFPLPKDSALWKTIESISSKRFITPKVIYLMPTSDDPNDPLQLEFEHCLLEDKQTEGGTYSQFLATCSREVVNAARRLL